jgi:F-type H+-transporting ATPase subunit delta
VARKNVSATNPTAVAYARSILELGNERGQAADIGRDLAGIREVIDRNPSFAAFLADPGIGAGERAPVLDRLFRGRVHPLVMNLLLVLNTRGRMGLLGAVADAYANLLDQQLGIVEVDVTVARRLDENQLTQVRERVSQALGKNAVVRQHVDEDIIGGLVIRVEDRLIDASVRYQLEAMRERMLAARRKMQV